MNSVFVSGSIEIKKLNSLAINSLDNIIKNNFTVLVGDARGIDSAVQKHLKNKHYHKVVVYSISNPPRNCASNDFSIEKVNYKKTQEFLSLSDKEKLQVEFSERKKQYFKDIAMSKLAKYYLAIWDKKSEGTKNNILRGIRYNKKVKLIIRDTVILSKEVTEKYINELFENEKGIGIKELKYRLDMLLGQENTPSKELLKKSKKLSRIYPFSSKTFLQNIENYQDFIVAASYRGNQSFKYRPIVIEKLKDEILSYKSKKEKNLSLI